MYDNIDMSLFKEHSPGLNLLDSIPQYLTAVTSEGISLYGGYVIGYLDSYKVSISENRVKLYDSSICKYFLGTNFKTLSKGDTKRAIEKISDALHLPFESANITRIDFANNMIMQYDEKAYYPFLGESQYYDRLPQSNGLYYNNKQRQLIFYGKEHEQKVKKQVIPELYNDRNVLRFELRYRKNLRKQFGRPEVNAALLYDEDFYYDLVKRWKNEYLVIQKIKSKIGLMKPTGRKKEFIENMALFTLLDVGQDNVLEKIKEWQRCKQISKKQASDLRIAVKELSSISLNEKGNELINELDKKIKEAARYC